MAKAPNTMKMAASGTKVSGRMANTMAKAPITMVTAASTLASGRMAKNMAKALYTMLTAASTLASGRMANTMAKAPNTMQTAGRFTKVSGRMANQFSDDSVYEPKQSER